MIDEKNIYTYRKGRMDLHFSKDIFERFSFTTLFTALLFFPLVGQWPADHGMLNKKCLACSEKLVKHSTFGLWLTA